VSSPPPEDNFKEIPEVLDRPHLHGVSSAPHARLGKPDDADSAQNQGEA